jgi:excisionase family DNA binding protein
VIPQTRRRLTDMPPVRCCFFSYDDLHFPLRSRLPESNSFPIETEIRGGGIEMIESSGRKLGNLRDDQNAATPAASGRGHPHDHLPQPPGASSSLAPRGAIPFAQRLACTVAAACEATGLGRTKLYELIGEGRLHTTTIGRRRLVMVRSLLTLLETENK